MTADRLPTQPRYAYENPADLAWGAQLLRTARRRRLLREAEQAQLEETSAPVPGRSST